MSGPSAHQGTFLAVERRRLPAWAMSCVFHLTVILLIAYSMKFAPRGTASEERRRTVGVALVRESSGDREYLTTEQAQETTQDLLSGALEQMLPSESEIQVDLSTVLPSGDLDAAAQDTLVMPSATASGTVTGGLPGLSNEHRTNVFGTSGSGNRFVYVFDRSGSMDGFGGRPLAAAKRELIASLNDLGDTSQFQIIFYNEEPHVFRHGPGRPGLVWANDDGRDAAQRFINGIMATGSTRHVSPLRIALGMQPDVVFFLTDADEPRLSAEELRRIRRWNHRSAINTIEFGFGPPRRSENFLTQLARENGGQHVYVDVSQLQPAR